MRRRIRIVTMCLCVLAGLAPSRAGRASQAALAESERVKLMYFTPYEQRVVKPLMGGVSIRVKEPPPKPYGRLPGQDIMAKGVRPKIIRAKVYVIPRKDRPDKGRSEIRIVRGKTADTLTDVQRERIGKSEALWQKLNDPPVDEDEAAAMRDAMLGRFDFNRDGKLDVAEAGVMYRSRIDHAREMLELFDADENGVLDEAERTRAAAAIGIAPHEWRASDDWRMYGPDLDADNVISRAELDMVALTFVPEARWGENGPDSDQMIATVAFFDFKNMHRPEDAEKARPDEFGKRYDLDDDGKLDEKERRYFAWELRFYREKMVPFFDDDKNGFLDANEAHRALLLLRKVVAHEKNLRDEFVDKLLEKFDRDRNGMLTPDEAVFFEVFLNRPEEVYKLAPEHSLEKLVARLNG